MKAILLFFIAVLFLNTACRASVDSSVINRFKLIIQLIESDNARELSKLIAYPLKRENPLPDIQNSTEFISDYPVLFDTSFKSLLKQYNDSDIFENNFSFGLVGGNFSGEIWINENRKISSINYSSKEEQTAKQILINKIKKEMYPTVNSWNENILVAKSGKLLIRVDRTDKGLRYVCWKNERTIKDSPNIILYNGVEEQQGTMGEWTWTFTNGDWTYVVHDAELCEEFKNCGLFLELLFKDQLKSKTRLTEIK